MGCLKQDHKLINNNRMTLEEYYIYCQNNENDKVRYDKSGSSKSKISHSKEGEMSNYNSEQNLNPNQGNLLSIPKGKLQKSGFKARPKTGKKLTTRIIGNFSKIKLLHDEIGDKKVNFNSSQKNSSIQSKRP